MMLTQCIDQLSHDCSWQANAQAPCRDRGTKDSKCMATNRKVCLGPGTEIQVAGKPLCRKRGPIVPPICWDFIADLGGHVN